MFPSVASDRGRLYQPTITRLPSLLFLLVFTLSLIALTELACRRLPPAKDNGIMPTMGDKTSSRLARRQQDSADSAQETTSIALDADFTNYLQVDSQQITQTPAPSAYLPIESLTPSTVTLDAAPTNYLPVEPEQVTETPGPSAYLPIISSTAPPSLDIAQDAETSAFLHVGAEQATGTPAASAFLLISSTEPVPAEPTPTPTPQQDPSGDASLSISSTEPVPAETTSIPNQVSTPSAGAFLPISSTEPVPADTTSFSPAGGPNPSAFLPLDPARDSAPPRTMPLPSSPAPTPPVTPGDPSPSVFLPLSLTDASEAHAEVVPSSNFLPLAQATTARASQQQSLLPSPSPSAPHAATPTTASGTALEATTDGFGSFTARTTASPAQTGEFQGESYSVGPNGVVVIDGTTFSTGTPTTATLADGKVVVVWPSGSISIQNPNDRASKRKTSVTAKEYVLGTFVPTLVAVVFSIPWHLLASAIKEMEPFYQLQHPYGVTAENSIALDYRVSANILATFKAIRKGHFVVWWSGLVSLVVLVIAPLSSETVLISFEGQCTATSGRDACSPSLSVSPIAARVLQGILAFIAFMTLALAIVILHGRSGVYANPLSIAGLSTLFQHPHAVESFRHLNPYCTSSKMIGAALRGYRFRVDFYLDDDGVNSYGLVISHQEPDMVQANSRTSFYRGKKYATVAVNAVEEHMRPERQRTISSFFVHPAAIAAFAISVAGLEILVIYYHKTGGDTGFEKFMDSQSFGVAFLFTAVGVMLKMYWSLLDDEIRNLEPYRQLLAGGVKASDSLLLAPHTNPFTGLFYSLRNGHIFNSYISLVAILCEPLIIALSNIPFNAGLTYTAHQASTWITSGILSMMLLGIAWMLCRKRTPKLVRRPDTVASVLLFLCGSSMLEDFKGMALMDREERDVMINRWDKRYAIGSVIGVDGVEREGVDESLFVGEPAR